jgi:hypothetical protein
MGALRTQIYLTKEQRKKLDERSRRERKSLAQLVREAIGAFLGASDDDAQRAFDETFGSLPDFEIPPRSELWGGRGSRIDRF